MRDPLSILSTPDEPRQPRARFAAQLRQRLQEAAMSSPSEQANDTETTTDPGAAGDSDTSVTPYTGGVSNLFYFMLPAPDLERSKAFFARVLGWQVGGGAMGGHIENVTPAGGLNPSSSVGEQSVFISVDDIDEAAAKLVGLGGAVEGEVQRGEAGAWLSCRDDQGTQFFIQDPGQGVYLEYARSPQSGSAHGDLFYFSLPVPDGEIGQRFYHAMFGWEFGEPGSAGGMNANNLMIEGGIGAGREGDRVELWFRVDDIGTAVAAVRDLGGDASDPEDTPQGTISFCHDDQGVAFGLAEPATGF